MIDTEKKPIMTATVNITFSDDECSYKTVSLIETFVDDNEELPADILYSMVCELRGLADKIMSKTSTSEREIVEFIDERELISSEVVDLSTDVETSNKNIDANIDDLFEV